MYREAAAAAGPADTHLLVRTPRARSGKEAEGPRWPRALGIRSGRGAGRAAVAAPSVTLLSVTLRHSARGPGSKSPSPTPRLREPPVWSLHEFWFGLFVFIFYIE